MTTWKSRFDEQAWRDEQISPCLLFLYEFKRKRLADSDMKPSANQTLIQQNDPRPMEIVGAGPLLSTIWKLGDEHAGWRYRFNLTRQTCDRRVFTDLFQPADLIHFIKLIQVLAFVIADDGCLTQAERTMLKNLATQLDHFIKGANVEADEAAASTPSINP